MGFIGRHLARSLDLGGYCVGGIGHRARVSNDVAVESAYASWLEGDITEKNLDGIARQHGIPYTVFHLAGGASVGESLERPREDFRRTVEATSQLLEWVRRNARSCRVVAASSAAVYGSGSGISEDMPALPRSPYGVHKLMMEQLCRYYSETFGLSTASVRLFSVYGPGLRKQLIWDLCCKLVGSNGCSVRLDGTGKERRDWLHVADAVRLLTLVQDICSTDSPPINGGSGRGTTVEEISRTVCNLWGCTSSVEFSGIVRPGDPADLVADTTRSQDLGFQPITALEGGIREVVEWFKKSWESAEGVSPSR
ncbi:MAG: NAD-dependent epimerase/dehydratase family protein [Candidatus Micrarchaeaceae archaeon]